ncbi:MAG: hypothetical protein J6J65_10990 [Opitutales bacterium]|nr:hypothetical protein [Opitutales bacterium]
MRNLEEKEIKQFSEFTEVTPESSQNLITDKGRFTVGALFNAVVAYATDLINAAVNSAVNGVQALITSAVDSATEEAQAAKSQAEAARDIALGAADGAVQTAGVPALRLGKKNAPQLWFDGGKLNVPDWTSVVIPLPFSLAIEYDVESWDGISYEYNNEFSFFNCTNADWDASGYPIYGFRLTKGGESQLGFTLGGCGGEGMGASRGWAGNITLPTGRHTVVLAVPAPDASGNSPASIPVYIDGENAGSLAASVGRHNASVSFQKPLAINERGVYAGGESFNEFEIALSRISIFSFDISAESAPYTVADYAGGKPVPPKLLDPSAQKRAVLALEDSLNGAQVRDKSGGANHAIIVGTAFGEQNNPAYISQKISWAGTATAQNVCGEKGAPADSLITIYARASSAVSLSVKCATNVAASKDLTAGVWTLCGSWTVPTAGAVTATPSAAFTGSIDFNVKIERFK